MREGMATGDKLAFGNYEWRILAVDGGAETQDSVYLLNPEKMTCKM